MKGLKTISKLTESRGYGQRTPLYYNIEEHKAFTEPGDGRFFITYLINYNTPKQIEETINYILRM